MIKEEFIEINGHSRNLKHYINLGYTDIKARKPITIKVEDLMSGSTVMVTTVCDNYCGKECKNTYKDYYEYTKGLTEPYYCKKCKAIKSKQTCLNKYGVENVMQVESIKDNLKKTLIDKYNVDHYSKTDEYKEKYKNTCQEKYGVNNASKVEDIKQKISDIRVKQFNVIDKYSNLVNNDRYTILDYKNSLFIINCKICNNNFDISRMNLYDRYNNQNILCSVCNPICDFTSSGENEIKQFLSECNVKFLSNSYDIIPPLSLNIFIPDLNIGIEFNGIYWHSEAHRSKYYHVNKTNKCIEQGIQLLHVWEDDWIKKQSIVKSIILNRLKLNINKIYARKCDIKEVSTTIAKEFMDANHIQGYSSCNIKLGLYYNGELVSLMLFGIKKKEMELVRFCNKLNSNVIGGALKLFNYFINTYNYSNIVSYCDISLFNGLLYEKMGFVKTNISKPNYYWVLNAERYHRFNFNKTNLSKKGFDILNKTEVEIMHENGYVRLWSCGHVKYVYHKK